MNRTQAFFLKCCPDCDRSYFLARRKPKCPRCDANQLEQGQRGVVLSMLMLMLSTAVFVVVVVLVHFLRAPK